MLLVASHSIRFGVVKTVSTIIGNITGLAILSTLSVVGLGSLLVHSPLAFTLIKISGACYLIYLGVGLWRKGLTPLSATADLSHKRAVSLYAQGIAVALSNPKAILFTTALFPQFIDPSINLLPQFLLLVTTLISLSFPWLLLCAIAARKSFATVRSTELYKTTGKLFGSIFISAGGVIMISKNSTG